MNTNRIIPGLENMPFKEAAYYLQQMFDGPYPSRIFQQEEGETVEHAMNEVLTLLIRSLYTRWPYTLVQAVEKPGRYVCWLRNGMIFHFQSAQPLAGGAWVRLNSEPGSDLRIEQQNMMKHLETLNFDCGFEVPVTEIIGLLETPYGPANKG